MKSFVRCVLLSAVLVCISISAIAQAPTLPYDHIHLAVPDVPAAVAWYEKNFGGKRFDEAADRLLFGTTRLIFQRGANPQPSAGSSIDHIGFSFANLDAKMKDFEAAGVKIVQPARDVAGLFKLGFVEDPWGTRIEVVQDADLLGLHHIHLRAPDAEQMFAFLLARFGGERTQLRGRLDAIRYRAPNFSDMWILVQRGDATPSAGHAVDHLGWRMVDLDAKVAEYKAAGVKVTSDPRALTLANGSTIHFGFIEGPSGVRIELVQR